MSRRNKTKKEIVTDIKTAQETERKRELIRKVIYPFLLELNDTIGFTKIFLQSSAAALESAFNETSKKVKVKDLIADLKEKIKDDEEGKKYIRFYELLQNETASDFTSMIEMMPRMMEQYFTQQTDKHPILDVDIDKLLG